MTEGGREWRRVQVRFDDCAISAFKEAPSTPNRHAAAMECRFPSLRATPVVLADR
jgi:hypothetical protein